MIHGETCSTCGQRTCSAPNEQKMGQKIGPHESQMHVWHDVSRLCFRKLIEADH